MALAKRRRFCGRVESRFDGFFFFFGLFTTGVADWRSFDPWKVVRPPSRFWLVRVSSCAWFWALGKGEAWLARRRIGCVCVCVCDVGVWVGVWETVWILYCTQLCRYWNPSYLRLSRHCRRRSIIWLFLS